MKHFVSGEFNDEVPKVSFVGLEKPAGLSAQRQDNNCAADFGPSSYIGNAGPDCNFYLFAASEVSV